MWPQGDGPCGPGAHRSCTETFIWKKKISKLATEGTLDPKWRKQLKSKREELRAEIDEVCAPATTS